MNYRIIILLLLLMPARAIGQRLTIEQCREMARNNYPAVKQFGLIEQSKQFTLDNASKAWLPSVSLTAGGYAFTNITDGDSPLGRNIDLNNQMANVGITVNQTIYDGGKTKAQRATINSQAEVDKMSLEVSLYDVYKRVEDLFFSILTIDEQLANSRLLQQDLGLVRKDTESRIANGISNKSDLSLIDVEIIKTRQNEAQLISSRKAYTDMLSAFVGKEIKPGDSLQRPANINIAAWDERSIMRPELAYLDSQSQLVDRQQSQLKAALLPTVNAFVAGMAHTNVSNFINNGLMLGGISFSWNIGNLYTHKNNLRKLQIKKQDIAAQRETFIFNNHLQHRQTNGCIEALKKQINLDDEIISLRNEISMQSQKKVALGTESTNELLRNINAASMAKLQKAQHEIMLLREIYTLRRISNNQ